jgi:hypothetical protein
MTESKVTDLIKKGMRTGIARAGKGFILISQHFLEGASGMAY